MMKSPVHPATTPALAGANGTLQLLAEKGAGDEPLRLVRLEVAADQRTILLVDNDMRKNGILRETRYEITPAELVALIRAHGAELPGENHMKAGS